MKMSHGVGLTTGLVTITHVISPCRHRRDTSPTRNAAQLAPYFTNTRQPRLRADQPAGNGQGRAVRALLAVGEVAAAAVPRRVRRQHARRRRPPERRRRRRARREAVRHGVQRVRRRLGRAAGRRAHRLRVRLERPHQGPRVGPADGLPRAVHPLRALHRQAARPLAVSRPGGGRGRAARALRRGRWTRRSRPTRRWIPADAGALRARAIRKSAGGLAKACTAPRSAPRRSTRCAACCRRRRSRTSASTAPARPSRRCCCACARTRSTKCAHCGDADARGAAQGGPGVPDPRRSAGPRRPMERVPRRHARARPPRSPRRCSTASTPEPRDEVTLTDFDPDGEIKIVAAALYAVSDLPDDQLLAVARADDRRRARRGAARLRRRARQPPPPARTRVRADGVPLRRPHRLRRLPRSAAPPAADARVAAADDAARLHRARRDPRSGRAATTGPGDGRVRRAVRGAASAPDSTPPRPTPSRWPTASASTWR